MKKLRLAIDIDNTITHWDDSRDYENFVPDEQMVKVINSLYEKGHEIVLFSARGMGSVGAGRISIDIVPALIKNLDKIGLKYHELITHKPKYDFIVDDKALRPDEFKALVLNNKIETHEPYYP
mgnify:CR=1 FL=1